MGQSYGPEARGGASKAEVIISDGEIDYPLANRVDLFLALTQEAADTYSWDLKPDGWIVVDSDLVSHPPSSRAVAMPFTATARDKLNKAHGRQRGGPGRHNRTHRGGEPQGL